MFALISHRLSQDFNVTDADHIVLFTRPMLSTNRHQGLLIQSRYFRFRHLKLDLINFVTRHLISASFTYHFLLDYGPSVSKSAHDLNVALRQANDGLSARAARYSDDLQLQIFWINFPAVNGTHSISCPRRRRGVIARPPPMVSGAPVRRCVFRYRFVVSVLATGTRVPQ